MTDREKAFEDYLKNKSPNEATLDEYQRAAWNAACVFAYDHMQSENEKLKRALDVAKTFIFSATLQTMHDKETEIARRGTKALEEIKKILE